MKRIGFSNSIKVFSRILMLLWFTGFSIGCSYTSPLKKSDNSAIIEGQKVLVLLRVTCEIGDESGADPVKGCISGENANMAMGDFETGGMLKPIIMPKFLSADTRRQGWTYFILEPGIYYLGFQGQRRTDALTYKTEWENVQIYRMDIEPDSSIIYIGTMHLHCDSDWFLFGGRHCCFIQNQVVKDETLLAQKLVSEDLMDMGHPKTVLLKIHTGETFVFGIPKPGR